MIRISAGLVLLLAALPAALASQGAPSDAAPAARAPVVYRLLADSRLEVKTGKSGFFSFLAHEHIIRAGGFEGEVHYQADNVTATTISIRIHTDSLEVLTPPDTAEIRKVTEAMREDVMHVTQYPEIIFHSTKVSGGPADYRVTASFTMHGVTREMTVPVRVEFAGDTLVAKSTFDLKQTDFGIKPYRGGPGGIARVADKVEFRIEARGLPQ